MPRCLRYRAPVLWLLLPILGGLASARNLPGSIPAEIFIGLALTAFAVHLVRGGPSRPLLWATTLPATLFFGGAAFYVLTRQRIAVWDELPVREVHVALRVERIFPTSVQGKLPRASGLAKIVAAEAPLAELAGQRIYFSLNLPVASSGSRSVMPATPTRSELYSAVGLLEAIPHDSSLAGFDSFLVNAGANFRLTRGRLLERKSPASRYARFCQNTLAQLSELLGRGIEHRPDLVAILRGMLLGQAVGLTPEQNRIFTESGTLHLFSISGLHIAAIAIALHVLLGCLRLPRWPHALATIGLLWLYVDITGTSPSAVRAFVMVALVELGFALRKPMNPIAALSFAALASVLVDPMQLFGASFQMSYGIVAGLLLLGLPLSEWIQEKTAPFRLLPKPVWETRHHVVSWLQRTLSSALGIGLATSLVSSLCGIIYFQLFTPGALLANLLLIPISTLSLWAGFLSMLCGLARLGWLTCVFNHAAALALCVVQAGIRFFVTLPAMYFPAQFTSTTWGFVSLSVLLCLLAFGYAQKWEWRRGSYLPPLLWVALVLSFGVTWH